MSSTGISPQAELAHDVLNLVENLRPHVAHLAGDSPELVKVRIYTQTIRRTASIDINQHFCITRYGMVPIRANWRTVEPVKQETLSRIPIMQLVDMRRTLIELQGRVRSNTVTTGGQ